ncbi:AAA family ATPase [Crateriforma spongiae]|uniref:AAA family ATPase n=1 Tax=Crateriforma spongiae TaxID=2724528 RepID=UPI0014479F98|nr:AAA family ATPase [Crateriforma spongiae]
MTLTDPVRERVQACFSGIWIRSHEHDDAIAEMSTLCRDQQWTLAIWDIDRGLRSASDSPLQAEAADPLSAVHVLSALADEHSASLLILKNFHRFLQSPEIIQAVARAVAEGRTRRTILVILAPLVQLPIELQRLFVVIDHELPDREQLQAIAAGTATESGEMPAGNDLQRVIDAAAGLTRLEAENAFALSLVRHGRLQPDTLWELKTQTLRDGGLLSLHRGQERFDQLGGLDALKSFTRRAIGNGGPRQVPAKGVLLLSPPGCGKSAFCKTLGAETGRPVLILDVGSLLGSLVGQSEERTRQALATIDAMAPCVVMIDEVEKAFAGIQGGVNDGGVASRMFGTFLTWLNDHTSDAFVVCTANDVRRLPPEFSRAERFDGVFFLDLPGREQKDAIWTLYRQRFAIDDAQPCPEDRDWTGAEILACCRLAALLQLTLVEAARHIVPIAATSGEAIESLRQWASGRCLSADVGGVYRHPASAQPKRRRGVSSKPSLN